MAMKYTELTDDERKLMLQQRLKQYEGEHFAHSINLMAVQALPADDPSREQAIETTERVMVGLAASADAVREALAKA